MRLPRDVSGRELARALQVFGYRETRQIGSHMRLTTRERGEHHLTIPDHNPLRMGMLAKILRQVAEHFDTTRDDIAHRLFGN
jgi:predicted RNA binding protein YcfA (HicA-like mRNA interferase family)